ncbi:MAG: hypothetical protein KJ732_06950 [Candidatus Margulisbacteria bacterium]|nr:hypothetical protein [Candidatus Margulisiibacteriota bacterium]
MNNADSKLKVVLPLGNSLLVEEGIIGLSVHGNRAQFQANYNDNGLDLSDRSDTVSFLYGARLSKYFDMAIGLSQHHNPDLLADPRLGFSYELKVAPSEIFAVGYGNEKISANNLTKLRYDGNWFEYPSFGILNTQRIDLSARLGKGFGVKLKHQQEKMEPDQTASLNQGSIYEKGERVEIEACYDLNGQAKLQGLFGRENNGQDVKYYEDGSRFAYAQTDSSNIFSSLGMSWRLKDFDAEFSVSRSEIDLSGRGSLYSEKLPDVISNVDNIDKVADLDSRITTNGCHFGLKGALSDRVAFNGKLSYLSMLLDGDANIWNSWFFGAVKQLENNYAAPFKQADLLMGEIGLKYLLDDEMEAGYTFKQLVPVSVENSAAGDDSDYGSIDDSGVSSGGSRHTVSLTYYF